MNEYWIRKIWPLRENMVVRKVNVVNEPLINWENMILAPLHIKIGLVKQFIQASGSPVILVKIV